VSGRTATLRLFGGVPIGQASDFSFRVDGANMTGCNSQVYCGGVIERQVGRWRRLMPVTQGAASRKNLLVIPADFFGATNSDVFFNTAAG